MPKNGWGRGYKIPTLALQRNENNDGNPAAEYKGVTGMIRLTVPRYGQASSVLGLPDRAIAITNSERTSAHCDNRWLLAYGDGLKPKATAHPMRFGSAGHEFLEDLHRWFALHDTAYPGVDVLGTTATPKIRPGCVWCGGTGAAKGVLGSGLCAECDGSGDGVLTRIGKEWRGWVGMDGGFSDDAEAEREIRKLNRMCEGYLFVYGSKPSSTYRLVAAELRIALPILAANGRPYTPKTWLVPEGTGWRLARTGEASLPGARAVRWPWYQCMTLDAVWAHRASGGLWVYEAKTARAPERRADGVTLDPQIAGYTLGLRYVVNAGLLEGVEPGTPVQGWIFDVLGNGYQHNPEALKAQKVKALHPDTGEPYKVKSRWVYEEGADGQPVERSPGLSKSVNAGAPSWRYRDALDEHGISPDDYQEHLLLLMRSVDPKLYVRTMGTSGTEVDARYSVEIRAVAARLATMRRTAASMPGLAGENDSAVLAAAFPRSPVCIQPGGNCSFRGLCLKDGALLRREYVAREGLTWADDSDTQPNSNSKVELEW